MSIKLSDLEIAIGQLSIAWALAEINLDACIRHIHYHMDGATVEGTLPMNSRGKVRYFRKVFNKLDSLASHREKASEWADELYAALDDRNWCIHGAAVVSNDDVSGPDFELLRFIRPDMEGLESKTVTIEGIARVRMKCIVLAANLGFLRVSPLKIIPEEYAEQIFSKLRIERSL